MEPTTDSKEQWLTHRRRLGELIAKRREELGLTVEEFATRAGITTQTVRRLVHREADIQRLKRRDIERALGWADYAIDEVLAGGEPKPADHQPGLVSPTTQTAVGLDWTEQSDGSRIYTYTTIINGRPVEVRYPAGEDEAPEIVEEALRRGTAHLRIALEE